MRDEKKNSVTFSVRNFGFNKLESYAVVYAVSVTWCTAKKCVWASAIDASCVKKRIFLSMLAGKNGQF